MGDDKKTPQSPPQQQPKPVNVVPAFPTDQKSNYNVGVEQRPRPSQGEKREKG